MILTSRRCMPGCTIYRRALFTVGADDHLVDDTLFIAARWGLAGNDTELLVYPESPHGCIGMPSVGGHWFPRLTDFLRRCVSS